MLIDIQFVSRTNTSARPAAIVPTYASTWQAVKKSKNRNRINTRTHIKNTIVIFRATQWKIHNWATLANYSLSRAYRGYKRYRHSFNEASTFHFYNIKFVNSFNSFYSHCIFLVSYWNIQTFESRSYHSCYLNSNGLNSNFPAYRIFSFYRPCGSKIDRKYLWISSRPGYRDLTGSTQPSRDKSNIPLWSTMAVRISRISALVSE